MSMPTCGEERRGEGEGVKFADVVVPPGVLSLPPALIIISLLDVAGVEGGWSVTQPIWDEAIGTASVLEVIGERAGGEEEGSAPKDHPMSQPWNRGLGVSVLRSAVLDELNNFPGKCSRMGCWYKCA